MIPPTQISRRMLFLSLPLGLMPYLALSSHLLSSLKGTACLLVTFWLSPAGVNCMRAPGPTAADSGGRYLPQEVPGEESPMNII